MSALRRGGLALFAPVLALVVALVISALVMSALGVNALRVFEVMLDFGETPSQQVTQIVVVLNRAIPLFLAGLAVAIAFRMGLFNIGVEGQYRLTAAGRDLYPAMLTIMRWGDKHRADELGPPVVLRHNTCGHEAVPLLVCSHCHEELDPREVTPERSARLTTA